jgi:hypothetical protein
VLLSSTIRMRAMSCPPASLAIEIDLSLNMIPYRFKGRSV